MNFVINVGRSGRPVNAGQLRILHRIVMILTLMITGPHMNDVVIDDHKEGNYRQVMIPHLQEKDDEVQLKSVILQKNDLKRRKNEIQVQIQVNINHSKLILYMISTFVLIFTSSSL